MCVCELTCSHISFTPFSDVIRDGDIIYDMICTYLHAFWIGFH